MAELLNESSNPLADYLKSAGPKKFEFGEMDCARFVAGWVERIIDMDPGHVIGPYKGSKEASAIIRRAGGMRRLTERLARDGGLHPVDEARPGDLALVRQGRRLILAICATHGIFAVKTQKGLCLAPMKVEQAWAITPRAGCGAEAVGALILTAIGVSEAIAGATIISTLTVAQVVGTIALTAASIGANYAMAQANRPKQEHGLRQQVIRQSDAPRVVHFGTVKVGGALVFSETKNGHWHRLIVTGSHKEGGIVEHWLGSEKVTVDTVYPHPTTSKPHYNTARIETRPGYLSDTTYQSLLDVYPGKWTTAHKLTGLPSALITLIDTGPKNFGKYFPGGIPTYRQVKRGVVVWDPRSPSQSANDPETWTWSDNPSLCILWYLMSADGWAKPVSKINIQSFYDFAMLCDQMVALKAGGEEKRYRLSGTISLDQPRKQNLQRMLACCDGRIIVGADGKIGIGGGQFIAPDTALTMAGDIVAVNIEYAADAAVERVNSIKPSFVSPLHDYQIIEAAAVNLADEITRDGLNAQSMTFDMCPSPSQAQRLAKIALHRINAKKYELKSNLGGKKVSSKLTFTFSNPLLETEEACFIDKFAHEYSANAIGCSISASVIPAAAWAWNPATEEGDPPPIPPDTDSTATPPAVNGLNVSVVRTTVGSGVSVARIRALVTAPGDNWITLAQYRVVGSTEWLDMVDNGQNTAKNDLISDIVADGTQYEVQTVHAGPGGKFSGTIGTWTTPVVVTVVVDQTAPGQPTNRTLAKSGSNAVISWTNANSANLAGVQVLRNSVNLIGTATAIATVYGAPSTAATYTDTPGNGTWYYYLKSVNWSGVYATYIAPSPQSVTIP